MSKKLVTKTSLVELIEKKEKLTPGVYVRSQKIPPIKPNMIQKVGKVMDELGIRKLTKRTTCYYHEVGLFLLVLY